MLHQEVLYFVDGEFYRRLRLAMLSLYIILCKQSNNFVTYWLCLLKNMVLVYSMLKFYFWVISLYTIFNFSNNDETCSFDDFLWTDILKLSKPIQSYGVKSSSIEKITRISTKVIINSYIEIQYQVQSFISTKLSNTFFLKKINKLLPSLNIDLIPVHTHTIKITFNTFKII